MNGSSRVHELESCGGLVDPARQITRFPPATPRNEWSRKVKRKDGKQCSDGQLTSSRLLCFFLVSVAGLADMLNEGRLTRGDDGRGEWTALAG